MLVLQADVTANDADDKALLKRFGLFGPPGILFFDGSGGEVKSQWVIGYQDAERFLASLPSLGTWKRFVDFHLLFVSISRNT